MSRLPEKPREFISLRGHLQRIPISSPGERVRCDRIKDWARQTLGIPSGGKIEIINGHIFYKNKDMGEIPEYWK